MVGDPLYSPFLVSLEEQMQKINRGEVDILSQYVVLRQANRFKRVGKSESDCIEFIKQYIGKMPDTALVWRMFEYALANKNNTEASKFALELHSKKYGKMFGIWGYRLSLQMSAVKLVCQNLQWTFSTKWASLK